jgi:hypothetical protein
VEQRHNNELNYGFELHRTGVGLDLCRRRSSHEDLKFLFQHCEQYFVLEELVKDQVSVLKGSNI